MSSLREQKKKDLIWQIEEYRQIVREGRIKTNNLLKNIHMSENKSYLSSKAIQIMNEVSGNISKAIADVYEAENNIKKFKSKKRTIGSLKKEVVIYEKSADLAKSGLDIVEESDKKISEAINEENSFVRLRYEAVKILSEIIYTDESTKKVIIDIIKNEHEAGKPVETVLGYSTVLQKSREFTVAADEFMYTLMTASSFEEAQACLTQLISYKKEVDTLFNKLDSAHKNDNDEEEKSKILPEAENGYEYGKQLAKIAENEFTDIDESNINKNIEKEKKPEYQNEILIEGLSGTHYFCDACLKARSMVFDDSYSSIIVGEFINNCIKNSPSGSISALQIVLILMYLRDSDSECGECRAAIQRMIDNY